MNVIPVDYNAATPSGSLRLDFPDTRQALNEINAKSGDWIWASDGEIFVGAHLEEESNSGLVATPRWQTLVSLDDYEGADFLILWRELEQALRQPNRGVLEETKVFQLITVFETIAPPNLKAIARPGYFPLRRAGALHLLGEPGLALVSIEEACHDRPDDPDTLSFYLEILRRIDSSRAESEAESLALRKDTSASVLAACINVSSAAADRLTDPQFTAAAPRILEWLDRFEQATGRDQVRASTLAQVQFNRGLLMLRLGRQNEALDALNLAHATDPTEPTIDEARTLKFFDGNALKLAERFRGKRSFVA